MVGVYAKKRSAAGASQDGFVQIPLGTRKSLGARRRDILAQFLLESTLLTFPGGAVGVILAALIAFAASKLTGCCSVTILGDRRRNFHVVYRGNCVWRFSSAACCKA